ncbi:MAG: transposase, partial [Clostridia bacterium]|nr:transposase [Clostridia bacterium]
MLTICKNDKTKVKELIKSKQLSSIVASNSDFIDDIILAMSQEGIIDCLDEGFTDKRRHNSFIPFKLIMALAVAAKMKIRTSLTDIPYAIQDYRTLAELGFNIAI